MFRAKASRAETVDGGALADERDIGQVSGGDAFESAAFKSHFDEQTLVPNVAEMRMDFFSGVLALRRKRKAEATIQALFEICQRLGIVLGPPATLARHAVEISFDRMPALFNGRLKGLMLTTAVLTTAFMRTDQPRALRVLCAAALSRALLAASKDGTLHTHPHDEDALLQLAQELILQFNNQQKTQLQAVSDRGAP